MKFVTVTNAIFLQMYGAPVSLDVRAKVIGMGELAFVTVTCFIFNRVPLSLFKTEEIEP